MTAPVLDQARHQAGATTPAPPVGPALAHAQRTLDEATAHEQRARTDWEAAASALVAAHRAATGNPQYVQTAYLWDTTADMRAVPPAHRASVAHLAEAEVAARSTRDRAGLALVRARQAVHDAQLAAQREWLAE